MPGNTIANTEKTETPTIRRQSGYRQIAENAGVDHEVVAAEIRKYIAENPEAETWRKETVFGLAITVHRLGLSLAPALGQAYLVSGKSGVELVIGYRGLLALAHRSGKVRGADAQVVREKDDFTIQLNQETYDIAWSSSIGALSDPGRIVGAFARVFLVDAPTIVCVMRMDAILELRERKGPQWRKDPEGMVQKTVLSRALRMVPALDRQISEAEKDADPA